MKEEKNHETTTERNKKTFYTVLTKGKSECNAVLVDAQREYIEGETKLNDLFFFK